MRRFDLLDAGEVGRHGGAMTTRSEGVHGAMGRLGENEMTTKVWWGVESQGDSDEVRGNEQKGEGVST